MYYQWSTLLIDKKEQNPFSAHFISSKMWRDLQHNFKNTVNNLTSTLDPESLMINLRKEVSLLSQDIPEYNYNHKSTHIWNVFKYFLFSFSTLLIFHVSLHPFNISLLFLFVCVLWQHCLMANWLCTKTACSKTVE